MNKDNKEKNQNIDYFKQIVNEQLMIFIKNQKEIEIKIKSFDNKIEKTKILTLQKKIKNNKKQKHNLDLMEKINNIEKEILNEQPLIPIKIGVDALKYNFDKNKEKINNIDLQNELSTSLYKLSSL